MATTRRQIIAIAVLLIFMVPVLARFTAGAGFYELSPLSERTEGASLLETLNSRQDGHGEDIVIDHEVFDQYSPSTVMDLGYLGDWHSGFRISVTETTAKMDVEVGQPSEWTNFGIWLPGDVTDISDMQNITISDTNIFSNFTDKIDVSQWIDTAFGSFEDFRDNPRFGGASSIVGMTTVPVRFNFDAVREGKGSAFLLQNSPEVNDLAIDRTVSIHGAVKLGEGVIQDTTRFIPQDLPGIETRNIVPEDVSITGVWGQQNPLEQIVDGFPNILGNNINDSFLDFADLEKFTYLRNVIVDEGSDTGLGPLSVDPDIAPIWEIQNSNIDINFGPGAIFLDLETQARGNILDFWMTVQLGDVDRNIKIACSEFELDQAGDRDLYFEVHLPIMWTIRIEYGVDLPTGVLPSMDWSFNDILDNWGNLLTEQFGEIGIDLPDFESRAEELRTRLNIPDEIDFALAPDFEDLNIFIPNIPPADELITYYATDVPEFQGLSQALAVTPTDIPLLDGILFDMGIAALFIVPVAVFVIWWTGRNRKGKK